MSGFDPGGSSEGRDSRRTILIVIGVAIVILLALLVGVVIGKGSSGEVGPVTTSATPSDPSPTPVPSPHVSPGKSPKPPEESPSTSPKPKTRKVTFHAYNVTLQNSEESDQGLRILVDSPDTTIHVRLKGGVPSSNKVVSVCPVVDMNKLSPGSTCAFPSNGEKVEIPHGSKYLGAEVFLLGLAPDGTNQITIDDIQVGYKAASGAVRVKTPPIAKSAGASACKDNACNPFFEMTPQLTGTLTAVATHEGNGTAQLSILAGDVAAHSYSATGTPYTTIDFMEGGFQLKVSGKIYSAEEAALALQNTGTKWLGAAVIDITWP